MPQFNKQSMSRETFQIQKSIARDEFCYWKRRPLAGWCSDFYLKPSYHHLDQTEISDCCRHLFLQEILMPNKPFKLYVEVKCIPGNFLNKVISFWFGPTQPPDYRTHWPRNNEILAP